MFKTLVERRIGLDRAWNLTVLGFCWTSRSCKRGIRQRGHSHPFFRPPKTGHSRRSSSRFDPFTKAPIMLTKSLAGQRGFVRHMKSGGSGMTSVFEITMVDVKKDRSGPSETRVVRWRAVGSPRTGDVWSCN